MKDLIGALALLLCFVAAATMCNTPKAEGQSACQSTCSCQSYSYTEIVHIGQRTVVCTVFVDACGNVTRHCS